MVTCAIWPPPFGGGRFALPPMAGQCIRAGVPNRANLRQPRTRRPKHFDGTLPAMSLRMARARGATAREPREPEVSCGTVRVEEECLELDVTSPREINILRRWLGRVNGPAHSQPYLVEGPPGRSRPHGRQAD